MSCKIALACQSRNTGKNLTPLNHKEAQMSDDAFQFPPRRSFLRQVIAVGAGTVASAGSTAAEPVAVVPAAAATVTAAPMAAGYQCFSTDEAAFTEAMLNIMCPADQFSANGVDCGLATFMDRQLSGAYGKGAGRYMQGPWAEGKPQLGLQLPLTPEQFFKAGVEAANRQAVRRFGKNFEQLSAHDANLYLNDLSNGKVVDADVALEAWFNQLIYPLFTQACFADPLYGGNRDKVFWKMLGYPGLPATHTQDMVKYRGKPYPGATDPKSILDFS
jgi:gluconate 2-dehydrogenase gamma chain